LAGSRTIRTIDKKKKMMKLRNKNKNKNEEEKKAHHNEAM
jgi:hypothetical protein